MMTLPRVVYLWMLLIIWVKITETQENSNMKNTLDEAKKILLFPVGHGYSSHIMDFRRIAKLLSLEGYHVSILINNEDRHFLERVDGIRMRIHEYACCESDDSRLRLTDDTFREMVLLHSNRTTLDFIKLLSEQQLQLCEQLFKNSSTLLEVTREQYDLLIVDYGDACSRVVVQAFNIPSVVYSGTGFSFDTAFFPNLPTMVPTFATSFSDEMDFIQRFENSIRLLMMRLVSDRYWFDAFDDLKRRYAKLPGSPSVRKAFGGLITFAHGSWAMDFPRPLLPTVIPVGGMHAQNAQLLGAHLQAFIDGAAGKGFIIVSFGSLVSKLDPKKVGMIATALARLEERVIWRCSQTSQPRGLGNNTLLLDWLPQNDLLAHPQARAFVTHCGIHSSYEAVQHAVPVVGIPLFADQFENAHRLVHRMGMGVTVDHHQMTSDTLTRAIRMVIDDLSYQANASIASKLLFDLPVNPRKSFLFYIDYVIRHRGAGPLASKAVTNLDTMSLYGVDVIALLSLMLLAVCFFVCLTVKLLCKCCQRACKSVEKVKTA